MDKKKLQQVFREIKKRAKLDFAITSPDNFGDCQSCVWYGLEEKYGDDCKGIWVKVWNRGMNADYDGIAGRDSVFIGHNLTDEQAKVVFSILGNYYNIKNGEYNPSYCIEIEEKGV